MFGHFFPLAPTLKSNFWQDAIEILGLTVLQVEIGLLDFTQDIARIALKTLRTKGQSNRICEVPVRMAMCQFVAFAITQGNCVISRHVCPYRDNDILVTDPHPPIYTSGTE